MKSSKLNCYFCLFWLLPWTNCDKNIKRLLEAMRQELFHTYVGNDTDSFLTWCEEDSAQSKCFTELKNFLHFRNKTEEFEVVKSKSKEQPGEHKGKTGLCKIVQVMRRLNSHIMKMDAILRKMIERNEIVSVAQNSNLKSYCKNFTKAEEASHMCKYQSWEELDDHVIKKNEEYWEEEKFKIVCHEYRLCIVDWFAMKGETVCNDLRQIAVQLDIDRELVDSVFEDEAPTPSMKTVLIYEGEVTGRPNIISTTTECSGPKCAKMRSASCIGLDCPEEEEIKGDEEKKGLGKGHIAVVVIGTLLLTTGIIYFIVEVFRQSKKKRQSLIEEELEAETAEENIEPQTGKNRRKSYVVVEVTEDGITTAEPQSTEDTDPTEWKKK